MWRIFMAALLQQFSVCVCVWMEDWNNRTYAIYENKNENINMHINIKVLRYNNYNCVRNWEDMLKRNLSKDSHTSNFYYFKNVTHIAIIYKIHRVFAFWSRWILLHLRLGNIPCPIAQFALKILWINSLLHIMHRRCV